MKYLRYSLLGLCLIGLSACQTWEGVMKDFESINIPALDGFSPTNNDTVTDKLVYTGGCPAVEAVEELSSLSEFTDASNQTDYNLIAKIDIAKIQNSCSYDKNAVTIDLSMDFLGTLGPTGRASSGGKPFFSYPFFVAVTSASGDILAKEIFAASMTYSPGQSTQTYTEKLRQIIPVESRDTGASYKVLVGFQLTPDQLAYNRKILQEEALRREAEAHKPSEFEQQARDAQEQAVKDSNIGVPIVITP